MSKVDESSRISSWPMKGIWLVSSLASLEYWVTVNGEMALIEICVFL
jgi:hypothetical protein